VARTEAAEKAAAASAAQVATDRAALAQLQADVEFERQEIAASKAATAGDRDQMAGMAAELLRLPNETIKKALVDKSQAEIDRLKSALAALPDPKAADVVYQMATLSEWRRSCDVWQIHVDDNNVVHVNFPSHNTTFRAETPEEFDRRLFDWYKTLSAPKTVVIMQVTWGNLTFGTKVAVKDGIVKCAERMRDDRNGRTLFEYVILGFRPGS
jgi:hypothetical protein